MAGLDPAISFFLMRTMTPLPRRFSRRSGHDEVWSEPV
jgi:hypothetical protein